MIKEAGQKMDEWQMEGLSFRSRTSAPATPSVSPNIRSDSEELGGGHVWGNLICEWPEQ